MGEEEESTTGLICIHEGKHLVALTWKPIGNAAQEACVLKEASVCKDTTSFRNRLEEPYKDRQKLEVSIATSLQKGAKSVPPPTSLSRNQR